MSLATGSIGSRIVEVVISSNISGTIVLGKRKAFASPGPSCISTTTTEAAENADDDSDFDDDEEVEDHDDIGDSEGEKGDIGAPGPQTSSERRYRCAYQNCMKSYTKPSRLAEHQRSHTGERPYVCSTCSKSYLRESHLQAHVRSHLPESERPLACSVDSCFKRFWTSQHLSVHMASIHNREKPYQCSQDGCHDRFAKHNQLRRHVADVHYPLGTKPYQCQAQGCNRSFATNQKLNKHSKVHEGNRYACGNPTCWTTSASGSSSPLYFPNWSALQAHIHDQHPPTCPYPPCEGRTFTSHKGLKGHLKVHYEKEVEDALEKTIPEGERPKKRRRGGEVGRDWACDMDGCSKTFKSKKAMTTHVNVNHLARRDHVCSHSGCGKTFGYKHLLQRHLAKMHVTNDLAITAAPGPSEDEGEQPSIIGWITGTNYTSSSTHRNSRRALVPCPWPDSFETDNANVDESLHAQDGIERCTFVFSRAYDLRRHLKADHSLELTKDEVDSWVRNWREQHVDAT